MNTIKLNEFPMIPVQGQVYEIIPDKSKIVASTNRLFNKYPTRYISAVPRFAIEAYSKPGDTVLDPFCGSGTTAIEAMLLGRNAVSIDIDPFARLLIEVKTTKYLEKDFDDLDRIIDTLQSMKPSKVEDYRLPDIPNINKWFSDNAILWLAFYKDSIDKLTVDNKRIRNFLYVVVAAIIRKVSNADEVSPKPYISTKYPKTPADPESIFYKTEALYRKAIREFSKSTRENDCTSIILKSTDARRIDAGCIVDLAVTSPPYINAYDYVRSLRFEDMWLGLANETQLKKNRQSYIGTEIQKSFYDEYEYANQSERLLPIVNKISKVDSKRANMVRTYFEDMAINLSTVRKALRTGGKYIIVVGDSKIRNQTIPTAAVLTEIAEKNGWIFNRSFKYVIRDRYLHLPRGDRGGIIKYDEVLILEKH